MTLYPDWAGMATVYSVLLLIAFLWWFFNTKSKNKLLEICETLSLFGAILTVAGAISLILETLRPFTVGEASLIIGTIISIIAGTGWLLLAKRAEAN